MGRIFGKKRPLFRSYLSSENRTEIGPFSRALPCRRRKFLSFSSRGVFLRQIRVRFGQMTAGVKALTFQTPLSVPARRLETIRFPDDHKTVDGRFPQDAVGRSETADHVFPSARSVRKALPANRLLPGSWTRPPPPAEESSYRPSMRNPLF